MTAANAGRTHHAWMLTGPKGIGKATFAWRVARYLLAAEPADAGLFDAPRILGDLDVPGLHPVHARVNALSEPRLFLMRREWDMDKKRFKTAIGIDDVRRMKNFFSLSAADGGARVVIVDAADEMTLPAANALLKMLEEPPRNTTLILVAHYPTRILPTIRSRCQVMKLKPLGADDLSRAVAATGAEVPAETPSLAELADGSVGRALSLIEGDGLALYAEVIDLMSKLPHLDRPAAIRICEAAGARGAQDRRAIVEDLFALAFSRLARHGAGTISQEAAPGETETFNRLAPDLFAARAWASFADQASARLRHGFAVNIDPPALFLDMILGANGVATDLARR